MKVEKVMKGEIYEKFLNFAIVGVNILSHPFDSVIIGSPIL